MSSVFGIVDTTHQTNINQVANRMATVLSHCPWFVAESMTDDKQAVALGRTGIGILNRGSQPIWNKDHTVALAMAGEFYDQDQLSKDLVLNAGSDEQIALSLYERCGEDFASRLHGVFVIVIWDKKHHR